MFSRCDRHQLCQSFVRKHIYEIFLMTSMREMVPMFLYSLFLDVLYRSLLKKKITLLRTFNLPNCSCMTCRQTCFSDFYSNLITQFHLALFIIHRREKVELLVATRGSIQNMVNIKCSWYIPWSLNSPIKVGTIHSPFTILTPPLVH